MSSTRRLYISLVLLAVGLAAHLLAADVEGGRPIHYRHHVTGFFLIGALVAIVVVGLGRVLRGGNRRFGLLTVAVAQAVVGLVIYAVFALR
jgi:hypothetical protein